MSVRTPVIIKTREIRRNEPEDVFLEYIFQLGDHHFMLCKRVFLSCHLARETRVLSDVGSANIPSTLLSRVEPFVSTRAYISALGCSQELPRRFLSTPFTDK